MRLSLGALLRDVGRPPRDKEGEGWVRVEGMWRLFLVCVEGRPLLFFSPPLPLFPRRWKKAGERKINHQPLVWSLNKMDWNRGSAGACTIVRKQIHVQTNPHTHIMRKKRAAQPASSHRGTNVWIKMAASGNKHVKEVNKALKGGERMGQAVLDRYPHFSSVLFFVFHLPLWLEHIQLGKDKTLFQALCHCRRNQTIGISGFIHIRILLSLLIVSSHYTQTQLYLTVWHRNITCLRVWQSELLHVCGCDKLPYPFFIRERERERDHHHRLIVFWLT